jgi:ribosome biogenesis GTPase
MLRGLILRTQSGFYSVETQAGLRVCRLRGRLKKRPITGDLVAVGDRVLITDLDGENGIIEQIEPRLREFVRTDPRPRGDYRQIIIANPDQLFFIFACAQPTPHLGMLDRYLVIAERQHIPARIIANKVDLVGETGAYAIFGHYESVGYPVLYTSTRTGTGIAALREQLAGQITLFSGPSGVGKSTLLNIIQPELGLAAKGISHATGKGRHTTVVRELFPVAGDGYVADSPGLKALELWDIEPEELDGYFPELRALVSQCAFSDCTHVHEPGCAVRQAMEQGQVHPERYNSYIHMRFGE